MASKKAKSQLRHASGGPFWGQPFEKVAKQMVTLWNIRNLGARGASPVGRQAKLNR
jgi:hypothetical protein